jgi:phage terminase small subunit
VAEYLVDLNATQAAIRAGYSEKSAHVTASRMLKDAKIAEAIKRGTSKQLEATRKQLGELDISAENVKKRLAMWAFQDIRELFDEQGNLRPIHQLSDRAAAMVAGLEVIKKNAAAGDGVIDTVHKVKVVDPVKAAEMLAKHFGLLTERIEHLGEVTIKWQD